MAQIIKIKGGANCYLITEGKKAILIDTGMYKKRNNIAQQCQGYDVCLIILTHGHIDHIQNAKYLSEKLNAPIAMHRNDIGFIKDVLAQPMYSRGIKGAVCSFFSKRGATKYKVPKFEPKVFLKGGDNLKKYGFNAKIVGLAGHTKGSIGVIVDDDKLIAGDAFINMLGASTAILFEDKERALDSAKKIQNSLVTRIYPGHGNVIKNKIWVKK